MTERRVADDHGAADQPVRATMRADMRSSVQPLLVLAAGRPVFANESCARLFGVSAPTDLLAGDDWRALVAPADRATAAALLTETLTTFRVLGPGGCVVPVLCLASDTEWRGGTARLVAFIDDTERWRRAEWQADLSWALDSISRGYMHETVLGIVVAACERAEPALDIALLCRSPDGATRPLARRRLPERLIAPLLAAVGPLDQALRLPTAFERFVPFAAAIGDGGDAARGALCKAGYLGCWMHASPVPEDGDCCVLVALSHQGAPDTVARSGLSTAARLAALTLAQHRAGTALRESEARTARSRARLVEGIESLADGFALWDADDRLVICNDRFREISRPFAESVRIGATLESILRAGLEARAFPEAEGREAAWLAERLRQHHHPRAPVMLRRANGRWLRLVERRTREGGIVTVYTDVTETVRREQELRAAKEEAERASRAKSAFLAQMSHELRTPLNAIIGFAELIMHRDPEHATDDLGREYLSDIHDSASHLLALINDILDLAKVESGRMELDEQVVDVAEVAASATSVLAVLADASGVDVTTPGVKGLRPLRGDRRKIRQVLINVISNAIKYSPRGGMVSVACAQEKGGLVIRVADSGAGMSAAEISAALEPFEQVDNPINRTTRGTGLGLPLSLALMELHGGALTIESEPGSGTTVTLRFPPKRTVAASGRG